MNREFMRGTRVEAPGFSPANSGLLRNWALVLATQTGAKARHALLFFLAGLKPGASTLGATLRQLRESLTNNSGGVDAPGTAGLPPQQAKTGLEASATGLFR